MAVDPNTLAYRLEESDTTKMLQEIDCKILTNQLKAGVEQLALQKLRRRKEKLARESGCYTPAKVLVPKRIEQAPRGSVMMKLTHEFPYGSQRLIRLIREICENILDFTEDELEKLRDSNANLYQYLTSAKA